MSDLDSATEAQETAPSPSVGKRVRRGLAAALAVSLLAGGGAVLALRSDGDPERDAKPPAAARPLD
ncbi:hypothetical protein, partial [Streptomyces acidiscabies]